MAQSRLVAFSSAAPSGAATRAGPDQATGTRDENGVFQPVEQWVLSDQPAHRALVTPALFWAAQDPATSVRRIPHRLLSPVHGLTASHDRKEVL